MARLSVRIASIVAATVVPCAGVAVVAQGVQPPALEFVFEELVTLAADIPVADTPYGGRNIVPITGGTFEGPGIRGRVLPGGWDWQLRRPDGCLDIKADYMLRTDDGTVINIVNRGVVCRPRPGERPATRTIPTFEAPVGRYDWLNRSVFVDTLEPAKGPNGEPAVRIRFYRVK